MVESTLQTEEPRAYLDSALDYIEEYALRKDRVAWPPLRAEAWSLVQHARVPAETYPAITLVLQRLAERHSFFLTPAEAQLLDRGRFLSLSLTAVFPEGVVLRLAADGPAAGAGIREGDQISALNGVPLAAMDAAQFDTALHGSTLAIDVVRPDRAEVLVVTLREAACDLSVLPSGRMLDGAVGYLELPEMSGTEAQVTRYADMAQRHIRALDEAGARSWIIDLRRNGGGNMWPMLVGVGPLLGDGVAGAFAYANSRSWWGYRAGQAFLDDESVAAVSAPYTLRSPGQPIAVLTSRLTASSGEFVALAFKGHRSARTFGEPTRGLPTVNDSKKLSDGAYLYLTIALGADRTGQTYDEPLTPDYDAPVDWFHLGDRMDPTITAARPWLSRQ